MCLATTKKETNAFVKEHKGQNELMVWKIYILNQNGTEGLFSPYFNIWPWKNGIASPGSFVKTHGEVKSNRLSCVIDTLDDDDYDVYDECWYIKKGIHVFTTREAAVYYLGRMKVWWNSGKYNDARIVCCHAKMKDFVAYNQGEEEAVFTKIAISPRNFRRAVTGK